MAKRLCFFIVMVMFLVGSLQACGASAIKKSSKKKAFVTFCTHGLVDADGGAYIIERDGGAYIIERDGGAYIIERDKPNPGTIMLACRRGVPAPPP